MGNLLKILRKDEGQKDGHDIFVNFENAEPTDAENEVFNTVKKVLEKSVIILKNIQEYNSASDSIRQAISNPKSDELQDIAWEAVVPLVEKLKKFYEFSQELDKTAKDLLEKLCSTDMTPEQHLEEQQALFKQFADILDFVLRFDDLKMTNPSIQNDFSYYRRTLSRMKLANEEDSKEYIVTNEEANRLALFYAVATPMLNMLSTAVTEFVSQRKDIPVEYTTECLHTMAKICKVMVETPEFVSRFTTSETKFFCLRVMVGVIILYDHVHPVGAFAKSSPIDMKGSIKVLKEQEAPRVEGLLNALRYTTKHLNDESTPKTIKVLLA